MVQEILVIIIVGAVILKVLYSLYKSITVKDKSLCGSCGSCDLKSELKKKGKLVPYYETSSTGKLRFDADEMKRAVRATPLKQEHDYPGGFPVATKKQIYKHMKYSPEG